MTLPFYYEKNNNSTCLPVWPALPPLHCLVLILCPAPQVELHAPKALQKLQYAQICPTGLAQRLKAKSFIDLKSINHFILK